MRKNRSGETGSVLDATFAQTIANKTKMKAMLTDFAASDYAKHPTTLAHWQDSTQTVVNKALQRPKLDKSTSDCFSEAEVGVQPITVLEAQQHFFREQFEHALPPH